jgi:hypothetical protein
LAAKIAEARSDRALVVSGEARIGVFVGAGVVGLDGSDVHDRTP